MKKFQILSTAAILTLSFASHAYDFQTLTTTPTEHECWPAEDIDSLEPTLGCKITNGGVIGTDSAGNIYNLPDGTEPFFPDFRDALDTEPVGPNAAPYFTLSVIESNTQDINLDGSFIGLTPGVIYKVGEITDYALTDERDGGLVLAMRVVLQPTVGSGTANQYEINNLFRFGFTGYSAAIGWSRGSSADLRLYTGARTRQRFKTAEPFTFDPDVVRLQSDVNVSEGNPRSGFFFIKTDAPTYTAQADAISLYQAGEEGQPINEVYLSGFVPAAATTTPVPLPFWAIALFAIALGYAGFRYQK